MCPEVHLMNRLMVSVAIAALFVLEADAKIKIRADYDKTFNFAALKSWTWHPEGAGEVKMAVTPDDNPEDIRARFEPVIKDAVAQALAGSGLTSAAGEADCQVLYYLLISTNMNSQQMGQFLPSTVQWGLPLFAPQTTALKVIEQGSLVVDVIAPALKTTVWRGVAQAEINAQRTDAERTERIRGVVRDMFKDFPPKK
jgi:hypothetical protein